MVDITEQVLFHHMHMRPSSTCAHLHMHTYALCHRAFLGQGEKNPPASTVLQSAAV